MNKFTKKEFTEIENLVECALSASSKDNARKYINKLRFLIQNPNLPIK